jgi:hypothetical protein
MNLRRTSVFLGTALSLFLLSSQVEAHWCNDLWQSAYNLVVRPESDTVTVPTSGSANLNVFVQNNMEYALPNFNLVASGTGATIKVTRQTQKVSGTLLPGEKAKFTLAITKSGGGAVNATDITFSVNFGNSGQDGLYGSGAAKAAMIKKTDGTLSPATPPPGLSSLPTGGQGVQLQYAAAADFGDTAGGLDKLLQLYCAGRGSWNTGSSAVIKSNCTDTSSTVCPTTTPGTGNGSKFDYMHLWAAGELAARKSGLGARAAVLRARLQCGVNDSNAGFAGFAMMMLGYLGEDAGARTFIQGKTSASGDIGTIAKAALLLMGSASDMTKYKADVTTGASSSSIFVKAACAAALGIAAEDDATVTSALIPLAKWTEPDTSDNGQAIYAAQLLNLVAWDRRGWAPNAGDTGAVTFYGETSTGAGGAVGTGGASGPGGASGTGGAVVSGGVTGAGGTTGAGGSTGKQDASPGTDARPGSGGSPQSNGGSASSGGTSGAGGTPNAGGSTNTNAGGSTNTNAGGAPSAGGSMTTNSGGTTGTGGNTSLGGSKSSGGSSGAAGGSLSGNGGSVGTGGDTGSGSTPVTADTTGCKCNLGGHAQATPATFILLMAGLAWISRRRRR